DLIRKKILHPETSLWLPFAASKAINVASRDSKRASSDPPFLAFKRVALRGNLRGDRNAASSMHQPDQQRMIRMRGNMEALEYPESVK
ncbi:hypothetical protein LTR17_027604, partial [Elasticomyces elasticus]